MKCEDISDALALLDDGMIEHTVMMREEYRSRQRNRSRIWKPQYTAACLCAACVSAGAVCYVFQRAPEGAREQEGYALKERIVQESPEPEIPERFVEVSSLFASNAGNPITEQAEKITAVPIGQYSGFYTEVPAAGSSVLSESMGESIDSAGEWHSVSGHSDLQYLIREDGQEVSLWKFRCFDSSEYPYSDVLELVYGIRSADGIAEIEVTPARMDNTDAGMKIQEEIGIRKITDADAIETMYKVLAGMTCYGSGRWDMIDYGNAEAPADGEMGSHEAVRLGRYLAITTDYGNVIDGLKYTAVSDMFYEFSGIAYDPLTEEQAADICEIIGIADAEEGDLQGGDAEADPVSGENGGGNESTETFLSESTNTAVSLEYVTELQAKVSRAMAGRELPFVIKSCVYEDPYRLHVVVTSDAEEDLQKLRELDTAGGVLEIEYSPGGVESLQAQYE